MKDLIKYKELYSSELLDNVIPFWERHSPDRAFGGYFTCLERDGSVFDTDKFVWLQGREVWFFAMAYNKIERREAWLDMALLGADFMERHGRDAAGNWYFSLTREGRPLVQPYNIFSDCFAAMAFAELYKVTGLERHKTIALQTFENIRARSANPKGAYNKLYPGTRPLKSFSLPMILCNLALILEEVIGSEAVDEAVKPLADEIMTVFYQPELGLILENVSPDGSFCDCFEGRCINPGHTNEAMWFLMDVACRYGDRALIYRCVAVLLRSIEFGWDEKHGGIFYFKDIKAYPPQQLEWDQKLWWVHIETLIALIKGYKLTGNTMCKELFEKIHKYTWEHFRDSEHPEWYGYLTREGKPLLTLKGGKWKGCFHVPRGLYEIQNQLTIDN